MAQHRSTKYVLGAFPHNELREIYAQGFGVCAAIAGGRLRHGVLQAMACGLPVILTRNVGAADTCHGEGVDGFVVPIRGTGADFELH